MPLRRIVLSLPLVLSCCLAAVGQAAVRDYYFERIEGETGLAQNTVTALAQDRDGFIWIGTQGGLHRFDGQRYAVHRHETRDAGGLPDSFITALGGDGRHGLWIGTYSRYVARLDLRDGKIRRYDAPGAGAARSHGAHVLALLAESGTVWVGTGAGLDRLDPATGQRHRVFTLPGVPLKPGSTQALARDARGTLWYATSVGLYRLDRDRNAVRVGPVEASHSLLRDRSGRLWVGHARGLSLLQDRQTLLPVWPRGDEAAAGGAVRSLAQAPDGHLWFVVAGKGLRRFDPATGSTRALRQNDTIPATLPEDGINAVLIDRGGLLWVGGQLHGVAVADSRGARFRYLVDRESGPASRRAAEDSVRALMQTRDRRLWLGIDDGRLLRHEGEGVFADMTRLLPPQAPGHDVRRVMAFADAGDGRPWVATTAGLFRLDPAQPALRQVAIPGLADDSFRSLVAGRGGQLWLGLQSGGLARFRPATGEVRHYPFLDGAPLDGAPHGPGHPTVHALLEDRRGRVWIGTGNGLDLLDPHAGRWRHFREARGGEGMAGNIVRSLWEAADGAIWIGTHGGLNRLVEEAPDRWRFSQPLRAIATAADFSTVFSLVEDARGDLWMGTDRGLVRYQPAQRRLQQFGLVDGLQAAEFNGGAAARLADGRLAFGGVNGLNLFDPLRTDSPPPRAPLRLLSAQIGADSVPKPAWRLQQLTLPETASILRLRVGVLDYLGQRYIRYRYRIDGLDDGWIDNGHRSEITYTLLPAGRHLFRAQATHRDGSWNPDELQLPIHVTPPPWRHPLAMLAYALAALAVLALVVVQWRRRRRRERGYFAQIRDREERLKLALWASGEQFWDYDLDKRELQRMHVQDAVRSASDIAVETEILDDHRIHRDDLPQVLERLRNHLRGTTDLFLSEHRIPGPDGKWMWIRARGRTVERGSDGRVRRIAGTARNITHSRHAERERRIASEVLRSMNEAVSVLDRNFDFVSVNPAFSRITGYTDLEVIGRNASLLDSAQHDPQFYRDIREQLQRHGRWTGEMWQQRKDGEEFLCAFECSVVLDGSGQHMLYVLVLSDITDQKRAEQELRYLANFDTLTNLPNRALLAERLSRAIVRARRQDDRIAVLFLDLDRFKDINDSLGHAAGDRILRAAAVRLQETVGQHHTVARLGGDEFTVVLENLERPDDADRVAREIITAFEAPLLLDDRIEVAISPSIGISLYPDNAQVPTELLKQADTAMYQAKAAGRRTYARYNETMDVAIRRRATVASALRKVLDRGELRLVFQPRMSLPRDSIVGVEALLRWNSAEYGEIPPTHFIPLAEESGLILEIGEWVLREACLTLRRWHQHGLAGLSMSVNVSALQLLRGDFPGVVERVLAETGVPAALLELELTESVIMANAEQTSAKLHAFRRTGVSLAIDDFGTGYSSLAYLKRLPITTLKIDKEFIGDLSLDPDDAAITTTVIAMAHSLGLHVVAEGVETEAQLQFLRQHGCDEIQGYWLSPPLEPQRCLAFIRNWTPAAPAAASDTPPGSRRSAP